LSLALFTHPAIQPNCAAELGLGVETDTANGADRFGGVPIFSNSQNRPSNKLQICLFAKREFGAASVQMKLRHADSRATSVDSPQPRWRLSFQFP